jgi:lipopolysaccharide/colanic/teichoic acid biosynthesis glycosyltransferase
VELGADHTDAISSPSETASAESLTPVGDPTLTPLLPRAVSFSGRPMPGKRAFDAIVAGALLIVLSPVLGATALAIKVSDAGPAIYRQRRVGRWGKPFEILKFRTMTVDAEKLTIDLAHRNEADGLLFKVRDDPRVTWVGRVLRRVSIDELPQLLNVLRGEMSLVGPRPLAVDPHSFDEQARLRHTVPPGITGIWQVMGGNTLSYREMIKLDLAYVDEWSLWLDIRILVKTARTVVRSQIPW